MPEEVFNGFDLIKLPLTFAVGFGLSFQQLRKLQADVVELTAKQVDRRRKAAEEFSDADLECSKQIDRLTKLVRSKASTVEEIREQRSIAAGKLVNTRVSRFVTTAVFNVHERKSDKSKVDTYFERHIFVEMAHWVDYLRVMNLDAFMDKYGCSPVFISVQSMDELRELSQFATDVSRTYRKFDAAMNDVLDAGKQEPFVAS